MKVNIRIVARQAGVSPATVSRVLNAPDLVRAETRNRVSKAMAALSYQPSEVARSLSLHKTHSIGVIVPGISNLFFIELHKGIHATAADAGMEVLLYDSKRAEGTVADGLHALRRRQIDGIIFSSGYLSEEYNTVISRLGIPVVLVLSESPNPNLTAFKVDDHRACFDAVSYLVSRGHRDILMISGPLSDPIAGRARYDGYCMALKQYGIPVRNDLIVYGNFLFEDGYSAMNSFLNESERPPFTAIFAASDEMAIGAIRALHEHGLRVPEDVSVCGYDDVAVARMVTPMLTTVAQPFYDIGARAVRALIDMIEGHADRVPPGVHYLPHQIISRESVAPVSEASISLTRSPQASLS